ncbi:MAG: endonuclease III [Acidobacteriota bacterium]|nr:endonuclease III [Acidobacteriota bacterium]
MSVSNDPETIEQVGKRQVSGILAGLKKAYPEAECALRHADPLQLLIATILSAQCTDKRVNLVTPELFRKYPSAEAFARASLPTLERMIHSTGFFRNKAKNIREACRRLVRDHNGQVPQSMEELLRLAGVARKTANVVLGTAYGVTSGVVVDTHVFRISRRLGLTRARTPEKVEQDLMAVIPAGEWINFSHRLIHHGRRICSARKPQCSLCALESHCRKVGLD